jgi:hypothetical protein
MPVRKKTKKRRKVRYSKLTIKLSSRQRKSIENYCMARKTTPIKLIKKMIHRYINGFDKQVPEEFKKHERQLDLFGED